MADLLIGNVLDGLIVQISTPTSNPQLQYFENFFGHDGAANVAYSNGTLSVHAVNIPLSISFNSVMVLMSFSSAAASNWSGTVQFGLYSLNGSTLSLANSAGVQLNIATTAYSWISMATSATQNISPGAWYFGLNILTNGAGPHTSASFFGNTSFNPNNAAPVLIHGRMTASTNAIPGTIATSNLDITGSDAIRQPYILLTA